MVAKGGTRPAGTAGGGTGQKRQEEQCRGNEDCGAQSSGPHPSFGSGKSPHESTVAKGFLKLAIFFLEYSPPLHMTADRARRIQSHQERVVQAVAEAVHEVGPHRLTVTSIIERAGISRSTFYALFENSADALAFSWAASKESFAALFDRSGNKQAWRPRVAEAIAALLEQAEAEPFQLELYLVHGHAVDRDLNMLGGSPVEALAAVLRPSGSARADLPAGFQPEGFIALGILSVIAERLRRGERGPWPGLGAELTELATLTLED